MVVNGAMKKMKQTYLTVMALVLALHGIAQDVFYSEPNRDELKNTNFEIIGQYNDEVLIFKNIRTRSYISAYDNKMKLVRDVELDFMPNTVMEATVFAYPNSSYLFYQYGERGIVAEMVVKLDDKGNPLTKPIELDTTIARNQRSKIYSLLRSEDKSKILLFKINTRDETSFIFKTMLFDSSLNLLHTTQFTLPMPDRNDFLTDFYLDNQGNFVFGQGKRRGPQENINQFYLVVKPALADSFARSEISFDKITLDEVKLRMDNYNDRYLFTGFYYDGRRTSIAGIANAIFDKRQMAWTVQNIIPIAGEFREDARGENNIKNAFNDYFIRDIIIRSDGAFLLTAEALYESNRGNNFNRWDYFGNPFMSPFASPYWGGGYGGMWGSPWGWNNWGGNRSTRYHADNVVALAFDSSGKIIWTNTIRKSQFDDDADTYVSYSMVNTGDGLKFLYNDYARREVVLNYQTITPEGQVVRNPTMRNLDRGYTFIPRFARQVAARSVIMPVMYRNYLCFARIEF